MSNKEIAIKYGLIGGVLIVTSWLISLFIWGSIHVAGGEVLGYAVMLLALTTIFLGIKNKRDQNNEDPFSFKEGFMTGLGIATVASLIYVIGWMIIMPNFEPDFMDKYQASQIELVQNSDATASDKESQINEIKSSVENYKKPYIMTTMTFFEIFPVGLFVTLISALVLQRKN